MVLLGGKVVQSSSGSAVNSNRDKDATRAPRSSACSANKQLGTG